MFPGINPELIKQAKKKQRMNIKPALLKVISTQMDYKGLFYIIFDQPIEMPESMSQEYWDILLEVQVQSNSDDSI